MGQEEYNLYAAAQEYADNVWKTFGDSEQYVEAQHQANIAWENYQYAIGERIDW